MARKLKVKKGDTVAVITGKEKGKSGEVLRVLTDKGRLIVQGVNVVKRHTKPSAGQPGGIVRKGSTGSSVECRAARSEDR